MNLNLRVVPLCERSFFRTIDPAEERFLKQPVTLVNIFGSARTLNFVNVGKATWIMICLSASHDDNVHKTAELRSRKGWSVVVWRILKILFRIFYFLDLTNLTTDSSPPHRLISILAASFV